MGLLRPDSSFWPRAGVWVLVAFVGAGGFNIAVSRVMPQPTLGEWLAVGGILSVGCLGVSLLLYEFLLLWREVRDLRDAAIAPQETQTAGDDG